MHPEKVNTLAEGEHKLAEWQGSREYLLDPVTAIGLSIFIGGILGLIAGGMKG
jgi:ABC-type dipeptide/oligopeptide/nickel transport system permease subunit